MKPAPFGYVAPTSVDDVVALLAEQRDEAKVLAGGQSLVPQMALRQLRPTTLIDINGLAGLSSISDVDGCLSIGALVRHETLGATRREDALGTILPEMAAVLGQLPIRLRGTVGGSMAHADPAAEWCLLVSALGGSIMARSTFGHRTIRGADFFLDHHRCALSPKELITEIRIPLLPSSVGIGFEEFSRRPGDSAIVSVLVVVGPDPVLAFGGVGPVPLRARTGEAMLREFRRDRPFFEEVAIAAQREVVPLDAQGRPDDFRGHLVRVLTARAIATAVSRSEWN